MRLLLTAVVCVTAVAGPAAQGPVIPKSPQPPTESSDIRETTHLIKVRGCIRGNRLKIDREASGSAIDVIGARDYSLEGPKELMRFIKDEHDNHYEEVVGIVVLPPQKDRNVVTSTKKAGPKTNIIVTGKGKEKDLDTPPEPTNPTLKLKVQELRHLDNRCALNQ